MTNQSKPRVLFLDIETYAQLNASWGTLIMCGMLWDDNDVGRVPMITDYRRFKEDPLDEGPLMEDVYNELMKADLLVTFYGTGFDIKFLRTVLLKTTGKILPPIPHIDLYFVTKHKLLVGRNNLDSVARYFELLNEKTHLDPHVWKRSLPDAIKGDLWAMKEIQTHCAADLQVTRELYRLVSPLLTLHPRLRPGQDNCRKCGGTDLEHRGKVYTIAGKTRYRVQCRTCKTWGYLSENRAR
jgi:uncharacterized protein YprB with RNaseH-like and TPR domain